MDFRDAITIVTAELTPQPWDYTTPDGTTLTVIPAGLREDPGAAEVYLRVTRDKTHAAQAAITTTDLPALITALDEPITEPWEHHPHYPDGTEKGRIGEWLGDHHGLTLGPIDGGFVLTAMEEADHGIAAASIVLPEAQRLPLASALRRALDVARGWEDA
ncbi:hypothetical protein ACFWD7_06355 [Streptomyces mirabilis]|uniref:hypothetical protein n=1 Tax=Streptomyces mirabilis TaxID=68239 RepID=UPI00367E295F